MKNNFITKIIGATLAFAMMIGGAVGINANKQAKMVDADANAYVIDFKNSVKSASPISASTQASTVIASSGRQYVKNQPFTVNSGNCYYGDNQESIRVGKSGTAASLSIALSTNYDYANADKEYSSIVVNCEKLSGKNNANAKISVNGSDLVATPANGSPDDLEFDLSTTAINSVTLATDAGVLIYSITLNEKEAVVITPTGITLNETELLLGVGGQSTLTATLTPDGASGTVTWSSSDEDVATVAAGVVTAVAAGEATITARVSETLYATCLVTVTSNSIPATSVTLNESYGTLVKGQTKTLTATVLPSTTTDEPIWSSSDEDVATVAAGVVTAVAAGEATITVTAGEVHADFTLTVLPLNAANNYVNAQVNITGKVVAIGGKNAMIDDGTAGLWAYTPSSNVTCSVGDIVNVTGQTIAYNSGLEVSPATITPASGTITTLTAEPITEDEVANEITLHSQNPNYIIAHRKVSLRTGTVATSGNYLIFPYGESTIEVAFSNCGMVAGKSYDIECYLTSFYNSYLCVCVSSAQEVVLEPTGITLNETKIVLGLNRTFTLTATVAPAGASQIAEWSSSDEDVATVEAGVVTAHSIGVATITATAGNVSTTCQVIVSNPTKADYSLVGLSSSNTGYANMYTNTFPDGQQWKIPGNQNIQAGLKIGGKPAENTDRFLYSISGYETVSKITIVHGAKDNPITVNSLTLYVYNSAADAAEGDSSKAVDTVARNYTPNSSVVFEPTAEGTKWQSKYFRIVYNMISSSTGSNYGIILTRLTLDINNPADCLDNTSSIKTISGVESNEGATVEQVALRFGGIIPVSDWNAINSSWPITDFGVMFARGSMLTARSLDSLEKVFRNDPADVAMVHRGSVGTPNANGDNYVFTARLNLEEADYDEVFYAAPFIVAGGEYYFLQEMHYSVRTLAEECLTSGESSLSQAALTTLKGNNQGE